MAEYIEREALINVCKEIIQDKWNEKACPVSWSHAYADFIEDIENQPSADVAPVRHGHWIRVKGIIQCDICGFGLFPDGYFFENGECTHSNEQNYRLNFCPNCGAKMDKES